MKRGCPDHPKTEHLRALLKLSRVSAVGHLELLFHFTAKFAMRGDIGKWADESIASASGWEGNAAEFVAALAASKWLEPSEKYRYVVHDWHDHADESVKKTLRNHGEWFVTISEPSGNFPETFQNGGENVRPASAPATAAASPKPLPLKPQPPHTRQAGGGGKANGFSEASWPQTVAAITRDFPDASTKLIGDVVHKAQEAYGEVRKPEWEDLADSDLAPWITPAKGQESAGLYLTRIPTIVRRQTLKHQAGSR